MSTLAPSVPAREATVLEGELDLARSPAAT